MANTNEKWELTVLKDLNESKISLEKHSVNILGQLDKILEISNNDEVKDIVNNILSQSQHTDLNRQKIERAMNVLIENTSISKEELQSANIDSSPSAKHIDKNDGESISEEDLAELIAQSK